MQAGALTFAAFGALSLYAVLQPPRFQRVGRFFFVGLIVLLVASLLNIFFAERRRRPVDRRRSACSSSAACSCSTRGASLRSGAYGQDDYVFAAVTIYLDLLNMFMFILSLLRRASSIVDAPHRVRLRAS